MSAVGELTWRAQGGGPARWRIAGGELEVVPGTGDIVTTTDLPRDLELHVEFRIPPSSPEQTGQDRGNSGVFVHGRYEIQILDSWHNETYPDGACGALYKQIAPRVNASRPPGEWQSFDITFRMPADAPGSITVVHNGVTIIDDGAITRTTPGALDDRVGVPGPLRLQDHGHRVAFRNIRVRAR